MPEDVTLHTNSPKQVTVVSNTFIDNFMSQANGEYVKIYLYLLRCLSHNGHSFSVSEMADRFDHTEKDIKRALHYWQEHNLLKLEYNESQELIGICLLDPEHAVQKDADIISGTFDTTGNLAVAVNEDSVKKISHRTGLEPSKNEPAVPAYSLEQLATFQNDNVVAELLTITEMYLGHTLNATETNTVIFWYDSLKLNPEVIDYLITYCIEKKHNSIHYMNKVAISFHEDGIQSVEEAKARNSMHSKNYFTVAKSLGITNRSLIQSEQELIEKWTKIYKLPLDIITEACRRTIARTNQPSFEYTDTILKSWHEKKVQSMDDIARVDAEHNKNKFVQNMKNNNNNGNTPAAPANRFHNFEERKNDYDELERKLLGY